MTRNWTDHPTSSAIKRKEIHITEIQDAYSERAVFLESSAGTASQITAPNPTMWYRHKASPLTEEEWNKDNPLADPIHWPPDEVPDNEFRNEHIYDLRTLLTHDSDYSGLAHPIIHNAATGIKRCFTVPDQAEYHSYNVSGEDLFEDAFNLPTYSHKTTLTAGSVRPHKNHINQLRAICEQLREVRLVPHATSRTWKEAKGESATSHADAWNNAKSAFASASWGQGSTAYRYYLTDAVGLETSSWTIGHGGDPATYECWIHATRGHYTLDLAVSLGTEWAKVLIWDALASGGWENVGVMAGISIDGGGFIAVDIGGDPTGVDKMLVGDVTMGNSSVVVIVSGQHNYNTTDVDLLNPTLTNPWANRRVEGFQSWQTVTPKGATVLVNCLPEWAHGAP